VEKSVVGTLINFRGLVYSPINEQGVVFLFGRILEDLNLYIEEIRIKYPDCVARRYTGKGWERIYIEFEYKASNFIQHGHDPNECNMIVCWENDLTKEDKRKLQGLEIVELKTYIDELDNAPILEPDKVPDKSEYDIHHHFSRKKVRKVIQEIYRTLDTGIKSINDQIFNKFAKTAVTYYSPEKNFVYLKFRQSRMVLNIFTNQQKISGVTPINGHENWGKLTVASQKDLEIAIRAIKKSHSIMRSAIRDNINTGWYAITPKEKMSWLTKEKSDDESDDE